MQTLWLARDKSGELYLYTEMPKLNNNGDEWRVGIFGDFAKLTEWMDNTFFSSITFENSPLELIVKTTNNNGQ